MVMFSLVEGKNKALEWQLQDERKGENEEEETKSDYILP